MSRSSISLVKRPRSFVTGGLVSLRKCWGCALEERASSLSVLWTSIPEWDHPSCLQPPKRIFNPLLIDCWELNACQFEWVLQSFKKCSVCKTRRLLVEIVHCHTMEAFSVFVGLMSSALCTFCVGMYSLTYYWNSIWEGSFTNVLALQNCNKNSRYLKYQCVFDCWKLNAVWEPAYTSLKNNLVYKFHRDV